MSLIENIEQVLIEEKYSKKYIRDSIIQDIKNTPQLLDFFNLSIDLIKQYTNKSYYKSKNLRIRKLKDLVQPNEIVAEVFINVLPINQVTPIQGVCTQLANSLGLEAINGIKTSAELITVLSITKLYTLYRPKDHDVPYLSIKSNVTMDSKTLTFIENTKYVPPMIVKPKPISNNTQSGYLSFNKSILLGKDNHHNEPQALDSINILNSIEYSLDERILSHEETPNKPLDTIEKLEQFNQLKQASQEVYNLMLEHGNKFYFDHRFDKRGRVYMSGYHINLQSTSYKKALMNFSKKEIVK